MAATNAVRFDCADANALASFVADLVGYEFDDSYARVKAAVHS